MPSRGLLVGGPLRTPFEAVALGKAEAPGSVGGPTAGGRLRRLVMECQGDRIKHVLPVALLPAPVLREVDAERREAVRDGNGDLRLLRFAIAGDGGPNALGRVHRECGVVPCSKVSRRSRDLVELIQPLQRVSVRLLHDHDVRAMCLDPRADVLPRSGEPLVLRGSTKPEHATGYEASALEHGVAEFPKSGIEGKDAVRILLHGV